MTPQAIVAADIDGDGRPDLAVVEYDSGEVGILHNQGDGTFVVAAQIPLPTALMDIAAADVDGDGARDLLVALLGNGSADAGSVAVLRNNGDGTFAPPVFVPAGAHPSAIVVADLNGDGAPDIAVVSQSENLLTVVLNKGDGTFPNAVEIQTGSMPLAITSGDFDHDGLGDLAITVGPSVDVFLNQGGGSFVPVVSYATDPAMSGAQSIAAADFDGDGWVDLAVGNFGGTLAILQNQHDGTFVASYATGTGRQAVAVDLNGDGAPDLVFPGNGVTVVMNQGGGTFAAPVSYGAGDGPAGVAAADLNGDGRPDLAVADFNGNTVSVLFNACLP
jgi:FG-GAP-like repeat